MTNTSNWERSFKTPSGPPCVRYFISSVTKYQSQLGQHTANTTCLCTWEILTYVPHRHRGRSGTSHRLAPGTWGRCTYRPRTRTPPGRCRSARSWPGTRSCPGNSHRHCQCSWGCTRTHDTCTRHFLGLKISFLIIMVKISNHGTDLKVKISSNVKNTELRTDWPLSAALSYLFTK